MPRTFSNRLIEVLTLTSNQITEIDNSTFAGMNIIGSLEISYNNISRIGPGTFNSLSNITYISLNGNRLTKMENILSVSLGFD